MTIKNIGKYIKAGAAFAGIGAAVPVALKAAHPVRGMSAEEIKQFQAEHPNTVFIAHNSFSDPGSSATYPFLSSQNLNVTDILNKTPVRGLELDVHKNAAGEYVVRHGPPCPGQQERSLDSVLTEINDWRAQNPNEKIYIDLDTDGTLTGDHYLNFQNDLQARYPDGSVEFFSKNHYLNVKPEGNLDNPGSYFVRGFNTDAEKTPWFADPKATLDTKELVQNQVPYAHSKDIYNPEKPNFVYLDQISPDDFRKSDSFTADLKAGPFNLAQGSGETAAIAGIQSGIAGASIGGGAALAAFNYRALFQELNNRKHSPQTADQENENRDILMDSVITGLSATSGVNNGVYSFGKMFPELLPDILGAPGVFAVSAATLGAGLLGTTGLTKALHTKISDKINEKNFEFFPGLENTDIGTPEKREIGERSGAALREKTSGSGERFIQSATLGTSILRGASMSAGGAAFTIATGAMAGGVLVASAIADAYRHHTKISNFIKNPEQAVRHYETEALLQKRFVFFGKNKITKALDQAMAGRSDMHDPLLSSQKMQELFTFCSSKRKPLKNSAELYRLLTRKDNEYLANELKYYLRTVKNDNREVIKSLSEKLNLSGNLSSKKLARQYLKLRAEYNLFNQETPLFVKQKKYEQKAEQTSDPKKRQKFLLLAAKMNPDIYKEQNARQIKKDKTLARFESFYNELKSCGKGDFRQSFKDRNEVRNSYKEAYFKSIYQHNRIDETEKYIRKSGEKFGKIARKKLTENNMPINEKNFLSALREQAKTHYQNKIKTVTNQSGALKLKARLRTFKELRKTENQSFLKSVGGSFSTQKVNRNLQEHYQTKLKKYSLSLEEQTRIAQTRKAIKKDVFRNGLKNGLKCAVAVGTGGLYMPPISGVLAVSGAGVGAASGVIANFNAKKRSIRWEKAYLKKIAGGNSNISA